MLQSAELYTNLSINYLHEIHNQNSLHTVNTQTLIQLENYIKDVNDKAIKKGLIKGSLFQIYYHDSVLVNYCNKMDLNSTEYLASLTKSFTAVALMILLERKQLSLDDPISKYGYKYGGKLSSKITIRDLLQHTSGVSRSRKIIFRFFPGMDFYYSNKNYEILSGIIQKVSGMPFSDFVTQNILNPLEMTETRLSGGLSGAAGLFGSFNNIKNFTYMLLDGGIYKNQRIIKTETLYQMLQPPNFMPIKGNMYYYGLGFMVTVEDNFIRSFSHYGEWKKTYCEFMVYPGNNICFLYFSQPSNYRSSKFSSFVESIKMKVDESVKNIFIKNEKTK